MIENKIFDLIQNNKKPISLEKFIDICLFSKEGYYLNANPLGKKGDFTTSSEVSQLFGEIIGLFILNYWQKNINEKFNFIELGPGKGTLLIDILRITKSFTNFHNKMNVHLIEKNNYLRKIQKNNFKLNNFHKINIQWQENFLINNKNPLIIIANEFFDCFPIRQFKKINEKWNELKVNYNHEDKKFFLENSKIFNKKMLEKLSSYRSIDNVEISEKREIYFNKICKKIKQLGGLFILIDYGYIKNPNYFTLQTIFNHKYSSIFENIGKQDISSFVDFNRLIFLAEKNQLKVDIFCTQKEFLLKYGIKERKEKIFTKINREQKKIIDMGYKRLIDNNEMGSTFKFLVLSSKIKKK